MTTSIRILYPCPIAASNISKVYRIFPQNLCTSLRICSFSCLSSPTYLSTSISFSTSSQALPVPRCNDRIFSLFPRSLPLPSQDRRRHRQRKCNPRRDRRRGFGMGLCLECYLRCFTRRYYKAIFSFIIVYFEMLQRVNTSQSVMSI
jgi:hypothetical protein